MSQSMSLTKFTAHLCERDSWRPCWGGRRRRHLENTLCRSGSCPPPGGCDIIKGGNAVLHFSLMKSFPFFFSPGSFPPASPASPALGRMPAACARPESQACQDRRERRDPPEHRGSKACWEKRCEEANSGNEERSRVKSCKKLFFVRVAPQRLFFLLHSSRGREWTLCCAQGDPGIRGPMGNPGKEGPKVGKQLWWPNPSGIASVNVAPARLRNMRLWN